MGSNYPRRPYDSRRPYDPRSGRRRGGSRRGHPSQQQSQPYQRGGAGWQQSQGYGRTGQASGGYTQPSQPYQGGGTGWRSSQDHGHQASGGYTQPSQPYQGEGTGWRSSQDHGHQASGGYTQPTVEDVRSRVRGYETDRQSQPTSTSRSSEDVSRLTQQLAVMSTQTQRADESSASTSAGASAAPLVTAQTGARSKIRRLSEQEGQGQGIPDSSIVRQFRDPTTGKPDFDAMRRDVPRDLETRQPLEFLTSTELSRLSRARMDEVADTGDRKMRKRDILERLPKSDFEKKKTPVGDRYVTRGQPSQALATFPLRREGSLEPSTSQRDDSRNIRVHRPLRTMSGVRPQPQTLERQKLDGTKPVGRMGYGPSTPSTELTPFQSQELQKFQQKIGGKFSQKEFDFLRRVQQIVDESPDLIKAYLKYRGQADITSDANRLLVSRMPTHSPFGASSDSQRVGAIQSKMVTQRGYGEPEDRLQRAHERMKSAAKLSATHMPKDLRDMDVIEEEEDDEQQQRGKGGSRGKDQRGKGGRRR